MKKKIGMVIVHYNDLDSTRKLLNNIKDYRVIDRVVVLDNHSNDGSYDILKKMENDKVVVIRSEVNRGYAAGLNIGTKYLIKELGDCHIIFSNSDILIKNEDDILLLSSDICDDVCVVGPVLYEHGNYNRGWRQTSVIDEILLNIPFVSRYISKKVMLYDKEYYSDNISYVDVVSGAFFMVDSRVLEKIDFFDENTFLYYEELIFSKKLKDIGMKVCVDNRVLFIHEHSVSINKNFSRINRYKVLKCSQRYYVREYLGGNIFLNGLLYLSSKLSIGCLYIRCLFKI